MNVKRSKLNSLGWHSRWLVQSAVLLFILVATVGLLGLCSCATSSKGLAREQAIVNTASAQAFASQKTVAAYAASKGGIVSLTQSIVTQILFYLGEIGQRGAEPTVNLDMAKHQLDTLGVGFPKGTYTVTVTDSDTTHCVTREFTIEVLKLHKITFHMNPPDTVYLSNPGITVTIPDTAVAHLDNWNWDFDDSTTSALQSPLHQYASSGVYNVSLTITRGDGSQRSITQNDILGVNQPRSKTVLVDTLRNAYVGKGSEVSFVSADANSSVIIDGKSYPLPEGSVVKMRVGSDVSGKMNIRSGRLVSFAFPDVTLFVNGTQVAYGTGGDCLLPSYHYFQANVTYRVLPLNGEIRQIIVDGNKIRAGFENSQIQITYQSRAIGDDLTLVTFPAYFEGNASTFTINEAVIASFEPGETITLPAPLSVSFRDTSGGSPEKWHWDFGDQMQSEEQNPVHVYNVPGSYTVTLTVNRGDQKDTLIRKNVVIASPPHVIANFSAFPQKGPAPLTVIFKDTSINAPSLWVWTFGPNSTPLNSSEQNPVVSYNDIGKYTVSLTAGNVYGSSDITRPAYIIVTEPFGIPDKEILVKTGKPGYLEKDSIMEFRVTNPSASITINGGYHALKQGSVVRLYTMSDQQGEIYINRGEILKFSFPDIAMFENGELVAVGPIDNIYVPAYSDFKTSISYYLEPNSAYTQINQNGFNVLGDLDNAWIRISNLGMNPAGNLRLSSSSNSTYIEGSMNKTVYDWVLS